MCVLELGNGVKASNDDKHISEGYQGGTHGWVRIANSRSLTNKTFTAVSC